MESTLKVSGDSKANYLLLGLTLVKKVTVLGPEKTCTIWAIGEEEALLWEEESEQRQRGGKSEVITE